MDLNGHIAVIVDRGSDIGKGCTSVLETRKAKVRIALLEGVHLD